MKKVLFGNGSHAELPMIQKAKEAGYYVITTGADPEGLGHPYADEYVYGDFSDKEFVYNLAKEKKIDGLVSGCNDFSYIATAYAAEKLGLKGHNSYENAMIVHQKDRFRKMCRDIGIIAPQIEEVYDPEEIDEIFEKVSFPVLVKPVDLTGGKGVKVCNSVEEVKNAAAEAFKLTRQDHIIIEEYIYGSNHGASFILKNHKVLCGIFDDEQYGLNKYLVLGACSPSRDVDEKTKKQLIKDVEKISEHLDLVDGLFHTQFILDKNNFPVIIDPCLRAPGDLYVLLSKYVTGVDYPEEILKSELGKEINDGYVVEDNIVARECIMADRTGIVDHIEITDEVRKHIFHEMIWAKKGDVVDNIMKYKAGILIMKFDTVEEMHYVLDNYSSLVKIVFEE